MRAIVYTRVSTDAQERDGTSLETQVQACLDYAAAAGWSVVATVRDAASGFSLERPGMTRVRDGMRLGEFDVVLAYAVDRLSRHQNHIGVLFDEAEGWGVKFEFVTERFEDTAIGRFILAARAFTAEVEREKIAERTMRGKAERARAGKIPQATGKGIYGYRYDATTGRREVDHEQAAVVRLVFERSECMAAGPGTRLVRDADDDESSAAQRNLVADAETVASREHAVKDDFAVRYGLAARAEIPRPATQRRVIADELHVLLRAMEFGEAHHEKDGRHPCHAREVRGRACGVRREAGPSRLLCSLPRRAARRWPPARSPGRRRCSATTPRAGRGGRRRA